MPSNTTLLYRKLSLQIYITSTLLKIGKSNTLYCFAMLIPILITLVLVFYSTLWPSYHWITNCFAFIAIISHFYNRVSSCLSPLLIRTDYSKDNRTCTFQSSNEIGVAKRPVNMHILRTFIIILWVTLFLSPAPRSDTSQFVSVYHGLHLPCSPLSTGYRVEFSRCANSTDKLHRDRGIPWHYTNDHSYRDPFNLC